MKLCNLNSESRLELYPMTCVMAKAWILPVFWGQVATKIFRHRCQSVAVHGTWGVKRLS